MESRDQWSRRRALQFFGIAAPAECDCGRYDMAMPDPVPSTQVLSYANPAGGQPANGRLIVTRQPTGITLIDPRLDQTIPPWLIRAFAIVCVGAGAAVFIYRLVSGHFERAHLLSAQIAIISGGICIPFAKSGRPQLSGVQVESGNLYKIRGSRRKAISGRLCLSAGAMDLLIHQMVYSLYARRWFTGTHVLFQYLTRDEAIWALAELKRAMKSGPSADPSFGI